MAQHSAITISESVQLANTTKTSNRHLSKLALELLRGNDHPNSDPESRLEGVSDLHVLELCVYSGKIYFTAINCLLHTETYLQIIWFFYPETANLTLEEIDFLFTDRARHPSLGSHAAHGESKTGGVGQDGDGSVSPSEIREDHVEDKE